MNGRIEVLSTENSPGLIKAENGVSARFSASEVAAHDTKGLAIGQLVTFDLEKGDPPKAVNISIERQHYILSHGAGKRPQSFRYLGFEQNGNIRVYRFERFSADADAQTAVVTIDLDLFVKHRVGIQDGPALCLELVTAEYDAAGPEAQTLQRSLTDQDMRVYLAAHAPPEKRRYGGPHNTARSHTANDSRRKFGTKAAS